MVVEAQRFSQLPAPPRFVCAPCPYPCPYPSRHTSPFARSRTFPFPLRNVFRAYWSMATVLALMELHSKERGFQYDAVVLARPDVWFHTDIDLPRQGMKIFLCLFVVFHVLER